MLGEVGLTLFTNLGLRVISVLLQNAILFVNTQSGNKIFDPVIIVSAAFNNNLHLPGISNKVLDVFLRLNRLVQ